MLFFVAVLVVTVARLVVVAADLGCIPGTPVETVVATLLVPPRLSESLCLDLNLLKCQTIQANTK